MTPVWARRPLIAMDSYKDHLAAVEASQACAAAWVERFPAAEPIVCPLSDGGDGLLAVAAFHLKRRLESYLERGDVLEFQVDGSPVALVESAPLLRRDASQPFSLRTSRALGQTLQGLHRRGVSMSLGLGGSLTGEFGIGAFDTLGGRAYDHQGRVLTPTLDAWSNLARVEAASNSGEIDVWADVTSPAANMVDFLPQKQASNHDIDRAHAVLERIESLYPQIANMPAMGAAGAVLVGLRLAGWQTRVRSGFEAMIATLIPEWAGWLADATIVVSGAGALDKTSPQGKVEWRVTESAAAIGKPAVVLPGYWDSRFQPPDTHVIPIGRRMDWHTAFDTLAKRLN